MSEKISLQDRYAPNLICFGCGPANRQGLQIKSFVVGETVVANFTPAPHHLAFEGMVNGGIIGTILDCHMNWTAAWHLMQKNELEKPPCCVTAHFGVTFKSPTPAGRPLHLVARVVESSQRKAVIECELTYSKTDPDSQLSQDAATSEVTAIGEGTFVAVKPGHPAFHRW